jgi:hypothetical protein
LAAVVGSGGSATGAKDALTEMTELTWQPPGYLLVGVLAIGLCCFAA